jgi:tRNA threonylcarbamoyladenosine biosynthesis protein TsaB
MICLALDTAGPNCSAALVAQPDTPAGPLHALASDSERIGRGHAERLIPMIDGLLDRAGKTYQDLNNITVTTGPGSFTGVRIGISAARGLALALGLEAAGIGVLDVITEQAMEAGPPADATIVAALDAGRGDVFVQATGGADKRTILSARKMPVGEVRQWIAGQTGPVHLIGSAELVAARTRFVTETDHADIHVLARMAASGAGLSPPRPLYLKSPDAKPQTGKAVARA